MQHRFLCSALAIFVVVAPARAFADGQSVNNPPPKRHDSRRNGILIGAAVGAALGILGTGMADCPGDNPSGPCKAFRAAGFAMAVGTGALIGFGIDSLTDQQSTVRRIGVSRPAMAVPPQRKTGVRLIFRW